MAIPTERSENVSFPRPLPHPAFFALATWVCVCGFAYWTYFQAARGAISIPLSVGFGILALVVIPFIAKRNREQFGGLVAAALTLLGYVLLMQDTLR
jgi:hypothetical protein